MDLLIMLDPMDVAPVATGLAGFFAGRAVAKSIRKDRSSNPGMRDIFKNLPQYPPLPEDPHEDEDK